jgi:two-component system OmpR family response regulator
MSTRPHLLLVDDEAAIREPLGAYLQRAGFRVSEAPNAAEARKVLAGSAIELVILCRSIREQGEMPVILLTARTEETDRIVGLEMGADDYVLKPFSPRELVARIKTILRRSGNGGTSPRDAQAGAALYRFEGWTLRADDWTLTGPDEVAIPLSTADYRLLQAFVTHPRQVLSRDQLLDLTQGREAHAFDRSIDNQISRLRRKLEDDARSPTLIKTVWGGGYMFSADVVRE